MAEGNQVSNSNKNDECSDEESAPDYLRNSTSKKVDCKSKNLLVVIKARGTMSRISSNSMSPNNSRDLSLEIEDHPVVLKTPSQVHKKKTNLTACCLWSSFTFSVLLVIAISLGMVVWSSNHHTLKTTFRFPESNSKSFPISDLNTFCLNRSSAGFKPELFTSGYDITLTNPLQKKINGRPLFEHTVFRECRLTLDPHPQHCQPNIQSFVIDNLIAFHQWTRHYMKFADTDGFDIEMGYSMLDALTSDAVSSANDDDLLNVQADLMSGNMIIMTHLNCPLVNTSRFHVPYIKDEYAQQLRSMTKMDEEELIEFIEDFGTHYMDQAILGSEIIFRFTIDRKKIEFIKRKNLSLAAQATATGQYIFSRSHASLNISKTSNKIAMDFIAIAKIQIYSGSSLSNPIPISDLQMGDHWIRTALKQFVVISLRLKPVEYLFNQFSRNNTWEMQKKWRQTRQSICNSLFPLGLTNNCHDINVNHPTIFPKHSQQISTGQPFSGRSQLDVYVLPLLFVWTNRSTVCLRTSWNHCIELCRNDPLCSAVTICRTPNSITYQSGTKPIASCPPEFKSCDCALHRQQDFSHGIVSTRVVTVVPLRQDLRPVVFRGYAVHGQPLLTVKRIPDLASCARLCSRTENCKIVSFSQYETGHYKLCKLFSNMTGNEVRRKGQAAILFMMATFNPCFSDEVESGRSRCPPNANCSPYYGMCICLWGYYKNNTGCMPHTFRGHSIDEINENYFQHEKNQKNLTRIPSLSTSTTLTETISAISSNEYELEAGTTLTATVKTRSNTQMNTLGTKAKDSNVIEENVEILIDTTTTKQADSISRTTSVASSSQRSYSNIRTQSRWDSIPLRSTDSYVPWQMRSWKNNNEALNRSSLL